MKRLIPALLTGLILLLPASAQAQGTIIPNIAQTFLDASGNECSGCLLDTWQAGTTTALATYSNSTLTTPNANPVVMDSAGRPTTGAIYLSAVSYAFRLRTSAGVTLWTLDPVTAIPTASGNVDVTGTAGEAITAGQAVYLSDGSGALTAGRWYLTDSDNTYSSTTAFLVGIAPTAIASAASGSIRIVGRVTGLSGLTAGDLLYAGATAGALTGTPPTNARFIGKADSTTTLVMGGGTGGVNLPDSDGTHTLSVRTSSDLTADRLLTLVPGDAARTLTLTGNATVNQDVSSTASPTFAGVDTGQGAYELYAMNQNVRNTDAASFNAFRPPQGRLTLTSATPVTSANVTAATTLYYALYGGDQITLYDGSTRWVQMAFTQLSITLVGLTAAKPYDVFVDYTAGTPALEVVVWTNDSTRATALTTQNGVYVQTADTDSLYVGTIYIDAGGGAVTDSLLLRHVWNYYNRVPRAMSVLEGTDSWTAATSWGLANGAAGNILGFVVGVAEVPLQASAFETCASSAAGNGIYVAVGLDSTTVPSVLGVRPFVEAPINNYKLFMTASLETVPAAGRHYVSWLDKGGTTTTCYGDNAATDSAQSGIKGEIEG